MKPGDECRILRALAVFVWGFTSVRVFIVDYPWGMNLWDAWIRDKAMIFHELAYIGAWFVCLITLSFIWQWMELETQKKYRKLKGA